MADEAVALKEQAGAQPVEDAGKREKSSIQFPYISLEEAVTIAKGVHAVGGTSCQVDQLAAHLNQKPDTGSFRMKLSAMRITGQDQNTIMKAMVLAGEKCENLMARLIVNVPVRESQVCYCLLLSISARRRCV